MATILDQHLSGNGWDVLLAVAGQPLTITFTTQPTEAELAERLDAIDRRFTEEIAAERINENEES